MQAFGLRYRSKRPVFPNGIRTKINYKFSIALYLVPVKMQNTIYRFIASDKYDMQQLRKGVVASSLYKQEWLHEVLQDNVSLKKYRDISKKKVEFVIDCRLFVIMSSDKFKKQQPRLKNSLCGCHSDNFQLDLYCLTY